MTDVEEQMAKQPHPFVNGARLAASNGSLVAIVGKVERVENGNFTLRTTDGKLNQMDERREAWRWVHRSG